MTEWYAYDQRWPLPDHWQQTARLCRVVMASSGNYKTIPPEIDFMPATIKPNQSIDDMGAQLSKLPGFKKNNTEEE